MGATIGDPQSWNAYVYSANDSVNIVDPGGTESITLPGTTVNVTDKKGVLGFLLGGTTEGGGGDGFDFGWSLSFEDWTTRLRDQQKTLIDTAEAWKKSADEAKVRRTNEAVKLHEQWLEDCGDSGKNKGISLRERMNSNGEPCVLLGVVSVLPKFEWHHAVPKYLGGAKHGLRVYIEKGYHQKITYAFRDAWKYGQGRPDAERLITILNKVYSKYPLPK